MKIIYILLLGISTCLVGCLSNDGKPVNTNDVKIAWAVPTNSWPSTLWTYKIVPQSFPPAVISNLMALGPFTESDKTNFPYEMPFKDKKMAFYRSKEGAELGIIPAYGWIYYNANESENIVDGKYPTNVPSMEKAHQLAQEYLRLFGIDQSQLVTKEDGTSRRLRMCEQASRYDENGKVITVTNPYVMSFTRKFEGVDFVGDDGVFFVFGNNAKLIELRINWNGLKHYQLYKTLDAKELMAKLQNHSGEWVPPSASDTIDAKKITVIDVEVFYRRTETDYKGIIKPSCWLITYLDYGNYITSNAWQGDILGQPLRPGEGIK